MTQITFKGLVLEVRESDEEQAMNILESLPERKRKPTDFIYELYKEGISASITIDSKNIDSKL